MWIDDPFPIKSVHFPNTVDQDPGPIPAMLDNPAGAVKANDIAGDDISTAHASSGVTVS